MVPASSALLAGLKPDGSPALALGELFLVTEETLTPQDLEPRAVGGPSLGPWSLPSLGCFCPPLTGLSLLLMGTFLYCSQSYTWFPNMMLCP